MYFGIDYGKKRTGIAKSDPTNLLASPLEVLPGGARAASARLAELVAAQPPAEACEGLVLGCPSGDEERTREVAAAARNLAAELERRLGLPVHLRDEGFTSREALAALRGAGRVKRGRRPVLDAAAAAILLQAWLDERRACGDRDTVP